MPIEFLDTFTDTPGTLLTSHTPDTGTGWTTFIKEPDTIGDWAISNTGLTAHIPGFFYASRSIILADDAPSSPNYEIEIIIADDFPVSPVSPLWMIARYDASDDNYYFAGGYFQDGPNRSPQGLVIGRKRFGTIYTLAATPSVNIAPNNTYRFSVTDESKDLYVNDILVLSASDNSIDAAGLAGLGTGSLLRTRDVIEGANRVDQFSINTTLTTTPLPKTEVAIERVPTPSVSQIQLFKWEGLDQNSVGEALVDPRLTRKTIQVVGQFTSGTVIMQGSVAPPGTFDRQWIQLDNQLGVPILFNRPGRIDRMDHAYAFRPVAFAGSDMDITVYLLSVEGA